jgi:hypothetical protein
MTSPRRTWAERIEAAKKRGKFTAGDKLAVMGWDACAVGEALGRKFRPSLFVLDPMTELGLDFCGAVCGDKLPRASSLYTRIQALAKRERAK